MLFNSKSDFKNLTSVMKICLEDKSFPNKNDVDLNGAYKSASIINEIYIK